MTVPDEAVEAAWDAFDETDDPIAALEAATPHLMAGERSAIQVEVLTHARAVITQWLSTAEKWRYDQVCADFQEMIDAAQAGELYRKDQ
jgi:hypothetical protein